VYGGNKKTPFSVFDRVDDPISLYAATKRANELIAKSYSHLYGLNTTGLRFFTVYGPWGRPDMAMFIFANNIINNTPINVYNNGRMKRDFTFIDDIVSGIKSAINKNYPCDIFNLGNNNNVKLMKMVELLEKYLNKKAIIEYLPMQPGDVPESLADIGLSQEKLDFQPSTQIDKGIELFIDWFKQYTNN